MADLRINPVALEGLLRRYRPDATTREGMGGTTEIVMNCPFHSDSHASFHFNTHKGVGNCFSCPDKKGYKLDETIAKFEGKPISAITAFLKKEGVYEKAPTKKERKEKETRGAGCGIKSEQILAWESALHMNALALKELSASTGWTVQTMRQFHIGYDGTAFTIPLLIGDTIVNIRRYRPHGSPKYSGETGHNNPILWPLANLAKPGPIWLMEGEKDCILANQCGLNAVTFTGGAGMVPVEYAMHLRGRDVLIVYDIDAAGKQGAEDCADILSRICKTVRVIELPLENMPANGDFTNYILNNHYSASHVQQLADMTEPYQREDITSKAAIPDEVTDTYLEELVSGKMFYRRVRMRVRIVSIPQGKTFIVPKEVHATCPRNLGDNCASCALFHTGGEPLMLTIKPEHPDIMKFMDHDDSTQKFILKTMLQIFPRCPKVKFDFKSFQAFYPVVFIPALERGKARHAYLMQVAWALDIPATTNEDYLAEAVIMSHPGTQALVVLCYKLDKDAASVDQFELTEELKEGLRVFQCQPQRLQSTTSSQKSTMTCQPMSPTSTEDTTCTSSSTSSTTPPSTSSSTGST